VWSGLCSLLQAAAAAAADPCNLSSGDSEYRLASASVRYTQAIHGNVSQMMVSKTSPRLETGNKI